MAEHRLDLEALDELEPGVSWEDVLNRAKAGRNDVRASGPASSRGWMIAAAAVVVLAIGVALLWTDEEDAAVVAGPDSSVGADESLSWEDDASLSGPELPRVGETVEAASGSAEGLAWTLVAYRTTDAPGGEARFCTEVQVEGGQAPQSCFPLQDHDVPAVKWSFSEVLPNHSVLFVVAVAPSLVVTLNEVPIDGIDRDLGLPFRLGTAVLGPGQIWFSDGNGMSSVNGPDDVVGAPGVVPGSRFMSILPGVVGATFERLTSDDPATDGWPQVLTDDPAVFGYINPVGIGDPGSGPPGGIPEQGPEPVYDAAAQRVGWWSDCGFSRERDDDCDDASVRFCPPAEQLIATGDGWELFRGETADQSSSSLFVGGRSVGGVCLDQRTVDAAAANLYSWVITRIGGRVIVYGDVPMETDDLEIDGNPIALFTTTIAGTSFRSFATELDPVAVVATATSEDLLLTRTGEPEIEIAVPSQDTSVAVTYDLTPR